jgi:hypothetical protein
MAGVSGLLLNQQPRARTLYANAMASASALSLADSHESPPPPDEGFDISQLLTPDGESEHGTERLIEALFTPVRTADPRPSPFTLYDPTVAQDGASGRSVSGSTVTTTTTATTTTTSTSTESEDGANIGEGGDRKGRKAARPWWRLRKAYHGQGKQDAEKYAALGLLGPETVHGRPPMLSAETGSDPGAYVRVSQEKAKQRPRPPMLSGLTGSEGFVNVHATPA